MCGRYAFLSPADAPDHFGVEEPPAAPPPRYNVAPGQAVPAVGLKPDGRRGMALLTWGLVPRWSPDPNAGPRPVNARAETVARNGAFCDSFRSRRCLLPPDGFYEWVTEGRGRRATFFRLKGGGPFAFAGLWDSWRGGGVTLATTCVVTTAANDLVRPVHDRMPVILAPADYGRWLDPATPADALSALLRPYFAGAMEAVPVGSAVNRVANDGPECLSPAE